MGGLVKILVQMLAELRRIRAFTASSMSIADAADCIGVSDKTVAKWINEGRLIPVPHTGRRVLLARVEIDRFTAGLPPADTAGRPRERPNLTAV